MQSVQKVEIGDLSNRIEPNNRGAAVPLMFEEELLNAVEAAVLRAADPILGCVARPREGADDYLDLCVDAV